MARAQQERAIQARLDRETEDVDSDESFAWFDGDPES
jgi:hypothetical protein